MGVVGFLPTIPSGVATFNNLTLPQQMAVVLIAEEDQPTHQRLERFLRAPVAFWEIALVNSAHHTDNSHILFNETQLGHIVNFLKYEEATGHHERVGHLPATNQAGAWGGAINLDGNPEPARH